MVCRHCIEAVKSVLSELGIIASDVSLGVVTLPVAPDAETLSRLSKALEPKGFSIARTGDEILCEQIKLAVLEHVRHPHECSMNLSACLEEKLHTPYDTLSRVFSSHEGRTIEKYHIAQRIEWVKELLGYGELSISEISDFIGYSSVAHLSRQFKSVTGLSPSEYLRTSMERKGINDV